MTSHARALGAALLGLALLATTALPGASAPGLDATIPIGPALFHMAADSVTVVWETKEHGPSRLVLLDAQGAVTRRVTAEAKPLGTTVAGLLVPLGTGALRRTTVTGLAPATRYRYRVEAGTAVAGPYEFTTAPARDAKDWSFRFVAFGDNRSRPDAHRQVAEAIAAAAPHVLLNTGDAVGNGASSAAWREFFGIERELLAATPSWLALGNHDAGLGRPYVKAYFDLPAEGPLDGFARREDYGALRVLVLDSEEETAEGPQLEWLEAELAAADRDPHIAWLFVAMHRPIYTFASHRPDREARAVLQPLFVAHHVDAVFTGHNHVYERFVVDGVVHIVTGGGGAPTYEVDAHVDAAERELRHAARSATHFVTVDLDPRVARVRAVEVPTGKTIDGFDLPRRR